MLNSSSQVVLKQKKIAALREIPGVLRSADEARKRRVLFSEFPEGVPRGALTEVSGPLGCGRTEWVLRFLAENPEERVAWVEENLSIYPWRFLQKGLDRVCFVETGEERFCWSMLEILRSQVFSVVVTTIQSLGERELKRLQMAAEKGGVCVLLVTEGLNISKSWPVDTRVRVDGRDFKDKRSHKEKIA